MTNGMRWSKTVTKTRVLKTEAGNRILTKAKKKTTVKAEKKDTEAYSYTAYKPAEMNMYRKLDKSKNVKGLESTLQLYTLLGRKRGNEGKVEKRIQNKPPTNTRQMFGSTTD